MLYSNEKQGNTLQVVVLNDNRFAVEERNGNASFNLTMMAKRYGESKKPTKWLRTDEAQRYLDALSVGLKCPTADLVEVRQGGTPERQGTWTNDYRIAVRYAQWLDMSFAIQIDELVHKVLTKQAAVIEPFLGVYPVVIKHKAVYNYLEVLKALGLSTRSGSVSKRRQKYANHFVKLYNRNFISLDFCHLLQKQMEIRQLEIEFLNNNALIA